MALRSMSLILMKDEGRTFKIRFAPQSLVIFLICLLLIPICLTFSVWLNVHLYSENKQRLQLQLQLQSLVDANAQQIARLTSLEQFLDARSPNLLHSLIPRSNLSPKEIETIGFEEAKITKELEDITSQFIANSQTKSQTLPEEIQTHSEASHAPQNSTASANIETELVAKDENQKNDLGTTTSSFPENKDTENKSTLQAITSTEHSPPIHHVEQESAIIQEIDLLYVLLEDFHIVVNPQTLKINYILRNAGKKSPLTGKQVYSLLSLKDGKLTKTPLTNVTDNTFRIKYLKEVDSIAQLDSLKLEETDSLLLEIFHNEEIIFSKSYLIH